MDEIEIRFGQWLRETRESKNLDLRTLSKLSGITTSIISRIENGLSAVTFNTVVGLCFGLAVTPKTLLEKLAVVSINFRRALQAEYSLYTIPSYLTILDLEAFKLAYRFDRLATQEILITSWKNILEKRADFHGNAMQVAAVQIQNAISDIANTPLEYPHMVYHDLPDVYHSKGVISLVDAGHYLRGVRQNRGLTLVALQETSHISRIVLGRIENGTMKRIRFCDMVKLVQLLGDEDILPMFWAAFEYHAGIEAIRTTREPGSEVKIALRSVDFAIDPLEDTLLRIARWYQCYPLRDKIRLWLDLQRQGWNSKVDQAGLYGLSTSYDYGRIFNKAWDVFKHHLFRLCGSPQTQYPEDDMTDYIPPEVKELWAIFLKYVATDSTFEKVRVSFIRHPDDDDFMHGLRSRFKEAWEESDLFKDDVNQYLRHYYPKFMDDLGV